MFEKIKWNEIISALVLLVVGVVLLFMPGLALVTIAKALGFILLIIGIIFILFYVISKTTGTYGLAFGIVFVALGIFVLVDSAFVVSILPIMFGIGIVLSGIMKLERALDLRKMGFGSMKTVIVALLNILLGVIVILRPFSTAEIIMQLVGISFIFSGITDLITAMYVSKKTADYVADAKIIEEENID